MQPTLVVRKSSDTASVAFTSHRSLTEGVRGRFHSHAFPISFHIFLACEAHARHRVKRLCCDWGLPLAHPQHSLVPVLFIRPQWVEPCRGVNSLELAVAAGEHLSQPAELKAAQAPSRRGSVPSFGSLVLRDPLRRLAGPGLSCTSK